LKIFARTSILLTIPLAIILLPKSMIFDGQTICLYKNLFEVNCLGCGITRAIFLVFEGEIFGAYRLNPGVLIVFPILVSLWVGLIYKEIKSLRF